MQLSKVSTFGAGISAGDPKILQMVKTMLDNPMIVSLGSIPWAVSLEVETYSKSSNAEVSKFPVVVPGTGIKQFLSDNVSPEPLTWQLSGYIPDNIAGVPNLADPFKTCWFTPLVDLNQFLLWRAYQDGARIMFKDMDNFPYLNCVISHLETYYQKDCKNKMPFKMTLQEIKVIEMSESELTETEANADADKAAGGGDMGSTAATKAKTEDISIIAGWAGI